MNAPVCSFRLLGVVQDGWPNDLKASGMVSHCGGFLLSAAVLDPSGYPTAYGFYPGCVGLVHRIVYDDQDCLHQV